MAELMTAPLTDEVPIEKNLEHVEFETKYRVEPHLLVEFKQLVGEFQKPKQFIYVEGPDQFFTYPDAWFQLMPQWDPNGTFIRYRKPSFGLDNGRRQVTWKYKPAGARTSIQRREHNWDVGGTEEATIIAQIQDSGAKFNCSIVKNCHIYVFEDATLVFYVVYDTTEGKPKKTDSFIEIEVSEEKIAQYTEAEAWDIIKNYEKVLAPLGISARNRMSKSLFELYRR